MQLLDQNAICYKTVSLHGTTEIQYNTNINVFFFLIETEIAQVKKLTSTLTLIHKNNNVIKKKPHSRYTSFGFHRVRFFIRYTENISFTYHIYL